MRAKSEIAEEAFRSGYNCAQSVLTAFSEDLGLDRKTALKVAAGLGGGLGRAAETCGAVSGAAVVLGLRYWRGVPKDAKERTYREVKRFVEEFKIRHGSVVCREILDCDIGSEDGYKRAKELGLFQTVCAGLVKDAVTILEGLI